MTRRSHHSLAKLLNLGVQSRVDIIEAHRFTFNTECAQPMVLEILPDAHPLPGEQQPVRTGLDELGLFETRGNPLHFAWSKPRCHRDLGQRKLSLWINGRKDRRLGPAEIE